MKAAAGVSRLTHKFPLELLEKVLEYMHILDILELKLVSHGFRDAIQKSPWTKHRINLYGVGALEEYHAKWENLNPVRKWEPGVGSNGFQWASVLGIYGVVADSREFIEFFTPESVSQGIPRKEWKIPLPQLANYSGFTFNPHSDMLVVVDWRFGGFVLHLLSMTTGEPHPEAENPTINCARKCAYDRGVTVRSISITDTRLAILVGHAIGSGSEIVAWDWREGAVVLDWAEQDHQFLGFVDEHSLAVIATPGGQDPRLQIFHTGMCRTQQTSFYFHPTLHGHAYPQTLLEPCGHYRSPSDESLTSPFHPDPSQRILLVYFSWERCCVINVEALLKLAQDRMEEDIRWDEWGADTIEVHVGEMGKVVQIWVSGCRLFSVVLFEGEKEEGNKEPSFLRIFDLSPTGRAKHLEKKVDGGEMMSWASSGLGGHRLPWDMEEVWDATTGCDTITFHITPDSGPGSNDELHVWSL